MTEVINGVTKTYSYTYNEDNRLISETVDGITVTYTYDTFGRLQQKETKQGNTVIHTEQIGYNDTDTTASTQVTSYNGFTYTYDDNGNITYYGDGNSLHYHYRYDSQNQLIYELSADSEYIYVWAYDNAGNITSRTEYALLGEDLGEPLDTVVYEYTDSQWGDLLTSFDGRSIIYDEIGNPLSDGEWTYSWKNGRQLASMSKGNTTWTFTYDANGMRTSRSPGYEQGTYTYIYNGDKLVQMSVEGITLHFTYDASGTPLTVKLGNSIYYYVTNLQGDVVGIKNSSGQQVVTYEYDAWGNLLFRTNTQLADYNPLRYRGYVYDRETGLYYLQSRYYDPELGRFINADSQLNTDSLLGYNQFAYCENSPIMYSDPCGTCKHMLLFLGLAAAFVDCKQCRQKQKEQLTYTSEGEDKGGQINNSSSVRSGRAMREYINENRSNDVAGTTTGVVLEWKIHNLAYDVGNMFLAVGWEDAGNYLVERADPFDFGSTIFDDRHNGLEIPMFIVYWNLYPISSKIDLTIELFERYKK